MKVLVLEKHDGCLALLTETLEKWAHEVTTAKDKVFAEVHVPSADIVICSGSVDEPWIISLANRGKGVILLSSPEKKIPGVPAVNRYLIIQQGNLDEFFAVFSDVEKRCLKKGKKSVKKP